MQSSVPEPETATTTVHPLSVDDLDTDAALIEVRRLARLESLVRAQGRELDAMRQRLADLETSTNAAQATVGQVQELFDLLTTDEGAWDLLVQMCRAGSIRNDRGPVLNYFRRMTGRAELAPPSLA